MPLDPALFRPEAIDPETAAYNEQLAELARTTPAIHEIPLEEARRQVEQSLAAFPSDPTAEDREIPGIDGPLTVRIYQPPAEPLGVYLHFHGSSWTVTRARHHDFLNRALADATGLAVVSPDYRLAPEHPYPAAWNDAESAAHWLVNNAEAEFGTTNLFVGGESAGGNLACTALLRMRDNHGYTGFKAANLVYGGFGGGWTPSKLAASGNPVFSRETVAWTSEQVFPDSDLDAMARKMPVYQDLSNLPPALFTIGTLDALLDDTLFMYVRWIAGGSPAEIEIYPGGNHGFDIAPTQLARTARARMHAFLRDHIPAPSTA